VLRIVIKQLLLQVTDSERKDVPEPSRYNPAYFGFPEYAKTPYQCIGDDALGNYIANQFRQPRGRINFHIVSQGFLSASLTKEDENSVDAVELSPAMRDQLRTFLKFQIREIEKDETARTWSFYVLSAPGVATAPAAVGAIWLTGIVLDQTIGSEASNVKTRLTLLAEQLRSKAQLYRSVGVITSAAGRQYVRYQYALRPNEREIIVLRRCLYIRR
jgi:hypothetical protein